ncbi:tol-pal system-associated acyl-CoA thioesterase [Amylibacter ulvae]|uniref:Tol-pal system-associated acyl-CoA thioesterase n=1 Tax=Paramylibacter ulvae TaxID=1651968 RepID=A0ABQ3D4X5_9RHOB|nr:tol-pal system-associated acyl-CoA thioesterase [Amylibacter ulvae]
MIPHEFKLNVFYEDTDMAGIVYYANYLKFIERGRSTLTREIGIDQLEMQRKGVVFAVRKIEAEYLGAAKLDDELVIATVLQQVTGAKILFQQEVLRGDDVLFSALITVVCIGENGRATRIPKEALQKFQKFSA